MSFNQYFPYPTPHMMQPDNANEQGFKEFLGCLRRRKKIVVLFTILALICGLLFALSTKRQYEAQAMVLVQPKENLLSNGPGNQTPQESVILSTVEMLQSRNVIDTMVTDLKLANAQTKEKIVQNIANHLTVKPVGRSLVVLVTYRHPNAELSARIVNGIVDTYQAMQMQQKGDEADKAGNWLNKHLVELSDKVKQSAQAVEAYRVQENLADDPQTDLTSQQLSDFSAQLITAQAEQAAAQATWSQVQAILHDKKSLDTMQAVTNSRLVSTLKRDEALLLSQQAELRSKYGDNHPKMKALQAEISAVQAKKERELKNVSQGTNNELLIANAKVETLQKNIDELQGKRKQENAARVELSELERQAKADRMLYQNFLSRYKEITLAGGILQPDVKVISAARVPDHPVGSPLLVILFMTGLTGFVLGIIAALLLEQMEHHIRTPYQLRMLEPSVPTLAMIPEAAHANLPTVITDHPYDAASEAVRNLRIALSSPGSPQIIALTSTLDGEGKSLTSLWLARMIAMSGARVLLIDGDTRSPTLYSYLGLDPFYSVSDVILGRRTAQDVITKDSRTATLSLLTGKKGEQGDTDLMTSEKIGNLVKNLQSAYDYIIIDTPPVLSVAETKLWLQTATKCLYLIRWDYASFSLVQNVVKNLLSDGIHLAGFVISRINLKEHAAYRYHDTASHYKTQKRA